MHWIGLVCTLTTYTKTVVTITKLYSGNKNGNEEVFKLIITIKAGWLQTYFCSKIMNIIALTIIILQNGCNSGFNWIYEVKFHYYK